MTTTVGSSRCGGQGSGLGSGGWTGLPVGLAGYLSGVTSSGSDTCDTHTCVTVTVVRRQLCMRRGDFGRWVRQGAEVGD